MKRSLLLCATLSLLFFVTLAFAQSPASPALSEGNVIGLQVEPNPLNATFIYDFELCCGYPGGHGGFLDNGFAYADGAWKLFFHRPNQKTGWTVWGNIDTWYTPQSISKDCTVQSGTLKDVTIGLPNGVVNSGLVAEYSQLFCQRAGVFWLGPGGLTVHANY